MNSELQEAIINFAKTLQEYFHNVYYPQQQPNKTFKLQPNVLTTNSIYNINTHDKKENKENKTNKFLRLIGLLSLGSVYIVSKDDYVKYLLSNIHDKIIPLHKAIGESSYSQDIIDFTYLYIEWSREYYYRSESIFNAKVIGILSSAFGLRGLIIGSQFMMLSGLIGFTCAVSFLLRRKITEDKLSESRRYYLMVRKLNEINEMINCDNINLQPSAPPMENDYNYNL